MADINVVSGDVYLLNGSNDRRRIVTVTKDGIAVDLTDTVPTFMVKRYESDDDDDALITKTIDDGLVLADPQTGAQKGVAYIELEEADTDIPYRIGGYPWELSAVDAVGPITLARGRFRVTEDLNRGS